MRQREDALVEICVSGRCESVTGCGVFRLCSCWGSKWVAFALVSTGKWISFVVRFCFDFRDLPGETFTICARSSGIDEVAGQLPGKLDDFDVKGLCDEHDCRRAF